MITSGHTISDHNKQMVTLNEVPLPLNKPAAHLTGIANTE
jgi:hypothetical protein